MNNEVSNKEVLNKEGSNKEGSNKEALNERASNERKDYRSLLEQVKDQAFEYLELLKDMPAYPDESSISDLMKLDEPMPDASSDPSEVMELLHRYGSPATCASGGGRNFGFVLGGQLPVAHAAGWMVDTWNQNAGFFDMSPAAAILEGIAEKWIVDLFGFPEGTAMGLVTGSANGLLTCFVTARNEIARRQGWDIRRQGFRNAPPMRIVLSEEAHSTVLASLYELGFGTDEMEFVPVDEYGRMIPSKVPALDDHTLFILQAGHIVGGSYDPLEELTELGCKAGAWIHVDGAFGLWAAASENQKHYVKGLEKADSCNMDAHKTLNAGYDNSIILCRNRSALGSSLALGGSYVKSSAAGGSSFNDPANTASQLQKNSDLVPDISHPKRNNKDLLPKRNNNDYTTEMSRRARGVILWSVLKQLGRSGLQKMIDHMCSCTEYFAAEIENIGFEKPNPVFFNQFFIKLSTDEQTLAALSYLQTSGITWMGSAKWKGTDVIRISVSSVEITRETIDECLPVFRKAYQAANHMY